MMLWRSIGKRYVQTVAVAMSGGIDSAVSAKLLLDRVSNLSSDYFHTIVL